MTFGCKIGRLPERRAESRKPFARADTRLYHIRGEKRSRALASYYDDLSTIVRGDLFTGQRWQAIWKMNTGQDDYLMQRYVRQTPDTVNPCGPGA